MVKAHAAALRHNAQGQVRLHYKVFVAGRSCYRLTRGHARLTGLLMAYWLRRRWFDVRYPYRSSQRQQLAKAILRWQYQNLPRRHRRAAQRQIRRTVRRHPWAAGLYASIASPVGMGNDGSKMYDAATRSWFGTMIGTLKATGSPWADATAPQYLGGMTGLGTLDDSNAFASVLGSGAHIIFLPYPSNFYAVSRSFALYSNLMLWGAGPGCVIKLLNNSNLGAGVPILAGGNGLTNVELRDVFVDGNRANQASGGPGIEFLNAGASMTSEIRLIDVYAYRAYTYNVHIQGQHLWLTRVRAEDTGAADAGIQIDYGVQNPNNPATGNLTYDVHVTDCSSNNNTAHAVNGGIAVYGPGKTAWGTLVTDVHILAPHSQNNGQSGQGGSFAVHVAANQLRGSDALPYTNQAGLRRVHCTGLTANLSYDSAVWIMGATGVSFTDYHIENAGAGFEVQGSINTAISYGDVHNCPGTGYIIHSGDNVNFNLNNWYTVLTNAIVDGCGGAGQANAVGIVATTATWTCLHTSLVNCVAKLNTGHGFVTDGVTDVHFDTCTALDNSQGIANTYSGFFINGRNGLTAVQRISAEHCRSGNQAGNTQANGWSDNGTNLAAVGIVVTDGDFSGNATAAFAINNNGGFYKTRNVIGWNPRGTTNVTTPGFPASTTTYTNVTNVDIQAYIQNGTSAMSFKISGSVTLCTIPASASFMVRIPAGETFTPTYAGGAPTWAFYGE